MLALYVHPPTHAFNIIITCIHSTEVESDDSEGEEHWADVETEVDEDLINVRINDATLGPAIPTFEGNEQNRAHLLFMWIVGFIFVLQAKYHLPNAAIDLLVKFMYSLLCVLGSFCTFADNLRKLFPRSLHMMRKYHFPACSFSKYPICRKCNKMYYSLDDCIDIIGSQRQSRHCGFVAFPNHPQISRRSTCNSVLLKTVHFLSGRKLLYPFKVYCYNGITSTLQKLLLRSTFLSSCEQWRKRNVASGLISDVYDGQVWKEFVNSNFFQTTYAYGLMLNMDFFQPYAHTVYSVGVIYLTIMNLPRSVRYKLENMIIVGIIPGPKEPSLTSINNFLFPLVSELQQFWKGVMLPVHSPTGVVQQKVKCALMCISCDLPAGRKVCGFLSHNARLGCSKCLKEFTGPIGSQNYSGFDRSQWLPRCDKDHRDNVDMLKKCKTKSELSRRESELGCRNSIMLKLPYFSPTRFLAIDPMHNLFLGTGKHMLTLWSDNGLLTKHHFNCIQEFVDRMTVPSDVGRIPLKISSGFAGFKADQFKNWITIYSIPALYQILPSDDFECWRHFVLACRILCQHSLTAVDLTKADALLMQFCKRVQRMYGEDAIKPNMHFHGHLKDVILDYGPIQEFWCFSFERYNGILGNQHTNNRAIEPQLMQQFLLDNLSSSYPFPSEFKENFESLGLDSYDRSRVSGSLLDTMTQSQSVPILPSKYKQCVHNSRERLILSQLFVKLNVNARNVSVNTVYKKYSSIQHHGKTYGSSGNRPMSCSYVVLASWNEVYFGVPRSPFPNTVLNSHQRPVNVHYYIAVTCTYTNGEKQERQTFNLAHVSWFHSHPRCHEIGKPAELWHVDVFEPYGIHSYVPFELILGRCAHCITSINDESLLVVVPLV